MMTPTHKILKLNFASSSQFPVFYVDMLVTNSHIVTWNLARLFSHFSSEIGESADFELSRASNS